MYIMLRFSPRAMKFYNGKRAWRQVVAISLATSDMLQQSCNYLRPLRR
jgi:hypothetical protein